MLMKMTTIILTQIMNLFKSLKEILQDLIIQEIAIKFGVDVFVTLANRKRENGTESKNDFQSEMSYFSVDSDSSPGSELYRIKNVE